MIGVYTFMPVRLSRKWTFGQKKGCHGLSISKPFFDFEVKHTGKYESEVP